MWSIEKSKIVEELRIFYVNWIVNGKNILQTFNSIENIENVVKENKTIIILEINENQNRKIGLGLIGVSLFISFMIISMFKSFSMALLIILLWINLPIIALGLILILLNKPGFIVIGPDGIYYKHNRYLIGPRYTFYVVV